MNHILCEKCGTQRFQLVCGGKLLCRDCAKALRRLKRQKPNRTLPEASDWKP